MREDVRDYAARYRDIGDVLFDQYGAGEWNREDIEKLEFSAAIYRVWTQIESSNRALQANLETLQDHDIHGVRAGSSYYSREDETTQKLLELSSRFQHLLLDLGLDWVIEADSPIDLVRRISTHG